MHSFPSLNQSIVPCSVLTIASWPAHMFLRKKVGWSGIPMSWRILQFVMIHTVKGFSVVNEAKLDVFLEFSCFIHDPTDVGNLISCSSAFSKSSLSIWKFLVHILLKPSLENFEHYFASMWNECCCMVVWKFFGIALLWNCDNLGKVISIETVAKGGTLVNYPGLWPHTSMESLVEVCWSPWGILL